MITQIRLSSLLIACALAGCASNGMHGSVGNSAQVHDPACPSATGSRIPSVDQSCTLVGRSYTREDINQTGVTSTAEALQRLDPSITAHH